MFLISAREASNKVTEKIIEMLEMRYDMPAKTVKSIAKGTDDPQKDIRAEMSQSNMLLVIIDPQWLQDPEEPNLNPNDRIAIRYGLEFVCPMILVFLDGAELPDPLPEDLAGIENQMQVTFNTVLVQSGINSLAQVIAPYTSAKAFTPILDAEALVAESIEAEGLAMPEKPIDKPVISRKRLPIAVRLALLGISFITILMLLIMLFDSLKR